MGKRWDAGQQGSGPRGTPGRLQQLWEALSPPALPGEGRGSTGRPRGRTEGWPFSPSHQENFSFSYLQTGLLERFHLNKVLKMASESELHILKSGVKFKT